MYVLSESPKVIMLPLTTVQQVCVFLMRSMLLNRTYLSGAFHPAAFAAGRRSKDRLCILLQHRLHPSIKCLLILIRETQAQRVHPPLPLPFLVTWEVSNCE